ncbi:hypothetical protein D3C81_1802560 [compost metagenome]
MVFHVGRGKGDLFLALVGDGQAVPQHVHALAGQLGFLGAPVDGLELHLHAHALARFAGHVDVETDQFVLLVTKAHGREVVVQPHHHLGHGRWCGRRRRAGCCWLILATGSQNGAQGQHRDEITFVHGIRK